MELLKLLFVIFIFLSLYSYIVYPLLLALLSLFFRKKLNTSDETPSVTLIISAFNEEAVIEKKIRNSLDLNYPKERLEIMVVSDHSTDRTDLIVKSFSRENVALLSQPARKGKTAGLNEAVKKASGDLLVFSDADAIYPSDTIRKMVFSLSDPSVGLVTGTTRYVPEGDEKIAEASGMYTRLERFIKRHEGRIGSCVGADGAIFAVRKTLYQPLQNDDINDLVIPLNVVRQGYRVSLDDDLYCYETSSPDSKREFQRQIRITNRTLRALFRHSDLMNIFRYPLFSFEIISHKLIRLSVPIFMLMLILLNLILMREGLIYELTLSGQILFYCGALTGRWEEKNNKSMAKLRFLHYFVLVNMAILMGWWKYLSGEQQVTWNVSSGA